MSLSMRSEPSRRPPDIRAWSAPRTNFAFTPTAVSHQIRLLEDFLQTKLFLRKNSRLELTADSRACLGKLTNALDLIDEALMSLRDPVDARQR